VLGVGISPLITAPLGNYLIVNYGVLTSFGILGIAFLILIVLLGLPLRFPDPDWRPEGWRQSQESLQCEDLNRSQMVRTRGFVGLSLVFLTLGDIWVVAQITNFTLYVTFLVINAAVIALRLHSPQLPRPFRIPLSLVGIPVTPVLGALVCVFFLFELTLHTLLIGAALLAITLGVSYLTLQKKD